MKTLHKLEFLILLSLIWTPAESGFCPRGHHVIQDLNGPQGCLPCPNNTFISRDNHRFTDCQRCSEPDELNHEVTVKPCVSVSNTLIGCTEGYFRRVNHRNVMMLSLGECEKCSVCRFNNLYEIKPCEQLSDTLCCPEPDMVTKQDEDGQVKCVKNLTHSVAQTQTEPIFCHRGEYRHQDQNGQQRCLPCPENTFISQDYHHFVDCKPCSEPTEINHEISIWPCTSVSDTIIVCKEGYFRINHLYLDMVAIGECEKCSDCAWPACNGLYEVQPCTQFSDTVCYTQPDLMARLKPHTNCS